MDVVLVRWPAEEPRRVLLREAQVWAERLTSHLRQSRAASAVVVAGSIRRCVETIGDLNLVAASLQPAELIAAFVSARNHCLF